MPGLIAVCLFQDRSVSFVLGNDPDEGQRYQKKGANFSLSSATCVFSQKKRNPIAPHHGEGA